MPAPSDTATRWDELTPEQQARRVVAANAVLKECFRLVGIERTAGLVLKAAGRE